MIATEGEALVRRWRAPALEMARGPDVDEAGRSLERLASGILVRAPHIIAACSTASHGPLECRGYREMPQVADRAWRVTHDGWEVFCILDAPSEQRMLGWIVGGWQARSLSAIERSIVAESIRRLLTPSPDIEVREEPRARPPARAWRCDVQLHAGQRENATLQLLAQCAPPHAKPVVRPDLRDVMVHMRATLPAISYALAEVAAWRQGSILPLQRSDRDISVGLYAGGRRLAVAQLGALFGERALKLLAVGASSRR